jgi:hypothetical protein
MRGARTGGEATVGRCEPGVQVAFAVLPAAGAEARAGKAVAFLERHGAHIRGP